jgi:hypothetical protein
VDLPGVVAEGPLGQRLLALATGLPKGTGLPTGTGAGR